MCNAAVCIPFVCHDVGKGKRAICKNPTFVSTTTTTTPAYNAEFSAHNYIEYRRGALPLILVASHGGTLEPDTIPERTYGTLEPDKTTLEIVLMVADEIETLVPVQVRVLPLQCLGELEKKDNVGLRRFPLHTESQREIQRSPLDVVVYIYKCHADTCNLDDVALIAGDGWSGCHPACNHQPFSTIKDGRQP